MIKYKLRLLLFCIGSALFFNFQVKGESKVSNSLSHLGSYKGLKMDESDSVLFSIKGVEIRRNYYDDSNKIFSVASFIQNRNYGIYLEFSESGQLMISGQFNVMDTSGIINKYCSNVSVFSNGYELGLFESYDECFSAKKNGMWVYYHRTGERQMMGGYENNLKTGEWEYYNLAGELILRRNYQLGKRVGKDDYIGENWSYSIPPE